MDDQIENTAANSDTFPRVNLEDIDKLQNDAVKEALQSVLRKGQLPQFHKDHGSHSNTP